MTGTGFGITIRPRTAWARVRPLSDSLTRRLFHHTEAGINTPGERLEIARATYESEEDPARKRVNAAMVAGALFNRATDIFNSVVDLAAKGVEISSDHELMRQCERYFEEALQLGKQVKHYSGHEGIDEMWGEPFKAFVLPTAAFYESRYLKIAQSMRDIDAIAEQMSTMARTYSGFKPCLDLVAEFSKAAKQECETMRRDPDIFQVWPRYVAAGEALLGFEPQRRSRDNDDVQRSMHEGKRLVGYISGARVPMPKSTAEFIAQCDRLRQRLRGDGPIRRQITSQRGHHMQPLRRRIQPHALHQEQPARRGRRGSNVRGEREDDHLRRHGPGRPPPLRELRR